VLPRMSEGLRNRRQNVAGSQDVAFPSCRLPMLDQVLPLLASREVARLQLADQECYDITKALRAKVLSSRGWGSDWTWRKAHAVEAADFRDAPESGEELWTQGPNARSVGNRLERLGGWLWLSRGTDWQAFQGGFRTVSNAQEGIRPSWVTFQVRVATLAATGANLVLSSKRTRWGLEHPTFLFSYRGDGSSHSRSFFLETCIGPDGAGKITGHPCLSPVGVDSDQAYAIAVKLDWTKGRLAVYINGRLSITSVPFDNEDPVKVAAVYNWRSNAHTAFSEIMMGSLCPYPVEGEVGRGSSTSAVCCRRGRRDGVAASKARYPAWLFFAVAVLSIALSTPLLLQRLQ